MPCRGCEKRREKTLAFLASLKGMSAHVVRQKMQEFRRALGQFDLLDDDSDISNKNNDSGDTAK